MTSAPALSTEQAHILATASLTDPAVSASPDAYYAAMRLGEPVHYDTGLGSWLVSRYEDLQTVFREPAIFSSSLGFEMIYAKGYLDELKSILERDGGGFFPDAISTDPPYHTRVRRLMEKAFTAHRVKSLEPTMARLVADMVESLAARGQCDAVKDFGQPMTINIICEQLGFEQFDAKKVERWSHAVVQQISSMQTREIMLANAKEMCELQNYIIARIREREREPRNDITSDIVHAVTEDGTRLTFEESVSLIRATMIAGNETTATALANLFFVLATQQEQVALLQTIVDDDRLLTRWVEEFIRLYPPVRAISRATTQEVELGGTTLPKGAPMLLLFASGNYDEAAFSCPHQFDMERANLGKSVSFGAGPHRCIGIALARMEIKVATREIINRLADFKLDIPLEDITFVPTVATRSIASLPVSFKHRGHE